MKTVFAFAFLLVSSLSFAQNSTDTLLLDAASLRHYSRNFQPILEGNTPKMIYEEWKSAFAASPYNCSYAMLDSIVLSNGRMAYLFEIRKVTETQTGEACYLGIHHPAGLEPKTFAYELYRGDVFGLLGPEFSDAKLVNGQLLYRSQSGGIQYAQDLFQPEISFPSITSSFSAWELSDVSAMVNMSWLIQDPIFYQQLDPYPYQIINVSIAPELTIREVKKEEPPFDFAGYFSNADQREWFRLMRTLPYRAFRWNDSPAEYATYAVLNDLATLHLAAMEKELKPEWEKENKLKS